MSNRRKPKSRRYRLAFLWLALSLLAACREGNGSTAMVTATPATAPKVSAPQGEPGPSPTAVRPTLPAVATPDQVATATREPAPTLTPGADRGPFADGEELRCGLLLPVVPAPAATAAVTRLDSSQSLETIPETARPAVARLLAAPETVGLVAYEIGREEEGIALNSQVPMPLASVVKIVHLIAYAEAVQAGELDPQTSVPLAELEKYYLANSDLNAHPKAVAELRAEGLVSGEPEAVPLEVVPRMMIEFSSNAATDYLHQLLGQERLEQTIVALGLQSHTAPCPFLGQFLLMGKRDTEPEVDAYLADPARYSREVWAATERYVAGEDGQQGWRGRWRRPSLETQADFSERLNTEASAGDYAGLMAQIAENQLGPWEQNVRIRRYLEWPTFFETNQRTLAWLGYKGGSLPGILTVAYYAQPWDAARPVVVVLFFRELPLDTYRQWRRTLPHDELARWLLYEREAIPLLRAILAAEE